MATCHCLLLKEDIFLFFHLLFSSMVMDDIVWYISVADFSFFFVCLLYNYYGDIYLLHKEDWFSFFGIYSCSSAQPYYLLSLLLSIYSNNQYTDFALTSTITVLVINPIMVTLCTAYSHLTLPQLSQNIHCQSMFSLPVLLSSALKQQHEQLVKKSHNLSTNDVIKKWVEV